MVGNDVTVTIIEVRGDKVRIGIDAPKNVQVHREEVLRAIQREAAKTSGPQPAEASCEGAAGAA